jgi:serine/threonine protein kinase/tetratricopeptide (TPR) repeat protein
MTERTIFMMAVEITDPDERATYLKQACAGDGKLRQQVGALLAAHEREGAFLDVPVIDRFGANSLAANPQAETQPFISSGLETETEIDHEISAFLAPSNQPGSLGRLGRYEVLAILGKGGMGTVLKAFDERLQRVVAVKVLAPQLAATVVARQRFLREARTAAAVRHPHVVAIHEVGEAGPLSYLVMQLVVGESLQERLKRTGPFPIAEVVRVGLEAAKGLAAAHERNLIHRDIKPANILIEEKTGVVRLTDFGLARAVEDGDPTSAGAADSQKEWARRINSNLTQAGTIAGTPMYMAPEQARGEAVDFRADLFSLGSVLYFLCTGQSPFKADSTPVVLRRVCRDVPRPVREFRPDVPQWLEDIITRLHAKDPAERFQSALALAEALSNGPNQPRHADIPAEQTTEKLPGLKTRSKRNKERSRSIWRRGPVIAACVLLLGAAVGVGAYVARDARTREKPASTPEAVADANGAPTPPSEPLAETTTGKRESLTKDADSRPKPVLTGDGTLARAIALAKDGRAKEAVAHYVQNESALALSKMSYVKLMELVDSIKKAGQLPEAQAACQAALRQFPTRSRVRVLLGYLQFAAGDAEAAETLLTASRLDASLSSLVGYGLGRLYIDAGQLDKAIDVWAQVVRDYSDDPEARVRLGDAYRYKARFTDAAAAYQEVMKLNPIFEEAMRTSVFSRMLEMHRESGNWDASVKAFNEWNGKVLAKLGKTTTNTGLQSSLMPLAPRLPSVLKGTVKPNDAEETYRFGELACFQKQYAAATRLFDAALAEKPDTHKASRYRPHPAASAARAGTGQGVDPAPSEEQANFRKLALKWLWADLRTWKAKTKGEAILDARRTYRLWLDLDDFAPLRVESELAKWPAAERKEWETFWYEVRALLAAEAPKG